MLEDPENFFRVFNNRIICLDEIQLVPDIFPVMRSIIDDEEFDIKFLITGSASPHLLRQSSETLAGRITYFYLTPITLNEVDDTISLDRFVLRGGFPLSLLSEDDQDSFRWREGFILTYLERDLRQFGFNIPPETLRRLWKLIAHTNGQVLNYSQFSTTMGISDMTVRKYVSILESTFMLRLLQPFHLNIKKRLIKSPKLFIKDVGITNALLNIREFTELFSHPAYGGVWEALCIENIIEKFSEWEPWFYRTSTGNELDLILTKANKKIAIEIKTSSIPKVTRGYWQALEDVKADKGFIIAQVKHPYPYKNGIWIYPIKEFLKLEGF